MVSIKRPAQLFSFGDFSKTQPREQHPGDRLDAQFHELAEAIRTTQDALAEIRRDDGQLKRVVSRDQIDQGLIGEVTDAITATAKPVRAMLHQAIDTLTTTEQNVALYAKDAEFAVAVAQHLVNGLAALRQQIELKAVKTTASEDVVAMLTSEAENWANYSHQQADNSSTARYEALQWAEYLAGPVVDAASAPDYIANSPFPNGLFYQSIEGGIAGLWSSKWWALQARNLVGTVGLYYLGAWASPPLPGEVHPDTGVSVPDPLLPGSLYYNTETEKLYVWTGSEWTQPGGLGQGFLDRFIYQATAGQTVFTGADMAGHTPIVGTSNSNVHLNGVQLVPTMDYTIAGNTLTIASPCPVGSMIQWDLLVGPDALAPGSVNAWKIKALTPNGTNQDFLLQYVNASSATVDANVGSGAQLQVVLDGVPQEPGSDFTASGNSLHMAVAPPADGDLWAVWYQPGA